MRTKLYIGFDIDETFIHSKDIDSDNIPYDDADFNIVEDNKLVFSTYIRPNASLLLNHINDNYNIFFYTRASQEYALEVLKEFGLEDKPLFHASHIEKETVDTVYEGRKKVEVKRLDKVAKKLNIDVNNIIFFDDIRNYLETRPVNVVVQVPAYVGSDLDNVMGTLYNRFLSCKNLSDDEIKSKIKNISMEELTHSANPLTRILKNDVIKNNVSQRIKKEP